MNCPTCDSTKGFVSKLVIVGRENGEDIVQERLVCKSCRRPIDTRRGPRGQLELEDDIARLEVKLRRTGSESIRRVLGDRRQRLAREYGDSD